MTEALVLVLVACALLLYLCHHLNRRVENLETVVFNLYPRVGSLEDAQSKRRGVYDGSKANTSSTDGKA